MKGFSPDARLSSALPYVREGSFFVDVGSDHAYLPIFLVREGRIPRAIASDVHDGPIARARENVKADGLSDKIRVVKTDGLVGIALEEKSDVAIFGMGGELIIRILADAPDVRRRGVRLILQPMTHQEDVRRQLLDWGFSLVGETLSEDSGRLYQTICADYTGERAVWTDIELLLGKGNIECGSPLLDKLIPRKCRAYEAIREGKRSSGLNTDP